MSAAIHGPGVGDFGTPGYWCEPFCVETVEHESCEEPGCQNEARWAVEVVGWYGSLGDPSPDGEAPTAYVCDKHLATVMDRWT